MIYFPDEMQERQKWMPAVEKIWVAVTISPLMQMGQNGKAVRANPSCISEFENLEAGEGMGNGKVLSY